MSVIKSNIQQRRHTPAFWELDDVLTKGVMQHVLTLTHRPFSDGWGLFHTRATLTNKTRYLTRDRTPLASMACISIILYLPLYSSSWVHGIFLPASPKAKAGLGVQSLRPSVPKSCHRNFSETTDPIIMKLGM